MSEHRIRTLLQKYQVKPERGRGQNFLVNVQIARRIVDAANISPDDTVLEIGPGLGVLTSNLIRTQAEIIVIEIEGGLVRALRDLLGDAENLEIIQGNALEMDLPNADRVVSNLPYNIASQITFRLISDLDFDCAVLMFQKEFADRLLATPGDSSYSRVSVNFQYYASAEKIAEVDAEDFYPVPKVDSTVLRITKDRTKPRAKDDSTFHALVRGIFSYPNKYLRNALGIWLRNIGGVQDQADSILEQMNEDMKEVRPRNLTLSQIVKLADVLFEREGEGGIPSLEGEKE